MSRTITTMQRRELFKNLFMARQLATQLEIKFQQFAKFFNCSDDDADISIAIWNHNEDRTPGRASDMLDELLAAKDIKVGDIELPTAAMTDREKMIRRLLGGDQ